MENPQGLLVALMFVTIVAVGVCNLLAEAAKQFEKATWFGVDWFQGLWAGLLLLIMLGVFWQSLDVLEVEPWSFSAFLLVIVGAVLLFVASISLPSGSAFFDTATPVEDAARTRGFFLALGGYEIWRAGMGLFFQDPVWHQVLAICTALIAIGMAFRLMPALTKPATALFGVLTLISLPV